MSTDTSLAWFSPDWLLPTGVRVLITTRQGGCSEGVWAGNNLALHVGDDPQRVLHNRQALARALPAEPQWLEQIHGIKVVEAEADGVVRTADGSFSRQPGVVCAVLTADCLPVLLCDQAGRQVAAAHAGWRGLANGVLAEAVASFAVPASELLVYLGPAISQAAFEVGIDVLEVFFDSARSGAHADAIAACFKPSPCHPLRFHADLYGLARAELHELGVTRITGGDFCTFSDRERFYSYRRDGVTGRMASLIWLT